MKGRAKRPKRAELMRLEYRPRRAFQTKAPARLGPVSPSCQPGCLPFLLRRTSYFAHHSRRDVGRVGSGLGWFEPSPGTSIAGFCSRGPPCSTLYVQGLSHEDMRIREPKPSGPTSTETFLVSAACCVVLASVANVGRVTTMPIRWPDNATADGAANHCCHAQSKV